jgi:hypothetical protein
MTIQSPTQDTSTATRDFPRTTDVATVSVYGLAMLSAGLFLFLPLVNLLHVSPWQRSLGTIHGCGAMLATVVFAYTGHLAFPLLRGSAQVLPQMRTLTFWSSVVSFLAIATGNLSYMRYRADAAYGGARAWLRANSPLVHYRRYRRRYNPGTVQLGPDLSSSLRFWPEVRLGRLPPLAWQEPCC